MPVAIYVGPVFSEAQFILHILVLESSAAMSRLSLRKVLLFKNVWNPDLVTVQYPYVAGASDEEQNDSQNWWFVYDCANDQGAFIPHRDTTDSYPVSV